MLLGPGRWGASTPSLGAPVNFSEICNMTVLDEVAFLSGGLMPELSYVSHFFQDLVEADIFYTALFTESNFCFFKRAMLNEQDNALEWVLPSRGNFKKVVKGFSVSERDLVLVADVVSQQQLCYRSGGTR